MSGLHITGGKDMQEVIVQIVTAFLGSLGFAYMFNLGKRNVIPAAVN